MQDYKNTTGSYTEPDRKVPGPVAGQYRRKCIRGFIMSAVLFAAHFLLRSVLTAMIEDSTASVTGLEDVFALNNSFIITVAAVGVSLMVCILAAIALSARSIWHLTLYLRLRRQPRETGDAGTEIEDARPVPRKPFHKRFSTPFMNLL